MDPPATIVCVECLGRCHLLGSPGAYDDCRPGDVLSYRCEDCMERFDVVHEVDEADEWERED